MATQAKSATTANSNVAKRSRRIKRGNLFSQTLPFWFIIPTLIVLALIQFYPGIYSFVLSTQDKQAGKTLFVGLKNFERIFSSAAFAESVWHTAVFLTGYIGLTLICSFTIALVLNRKMRFSPLYITLIFVPWVIADIIVGMVWRLLVVPDYGLLSPILGNPDIFPPKGISILTSSASPQLIKGIPFPPAPAMVYLIIASAWRALPFSTLLILAGLQTVPKEIVESSRIDGAGSWQTLRFILFPLVLPTLIVVLFNLSLGGINGIGMVFGLTNGGPGTSTEVLSFLLYTIGFGRLEFGRAAALAVVMAIINLGLILVALYVSRSDRQEQQA